MGENSGRPCKACGVLLRFEPSAKTGKLVPINVESGQNHWTDCPNVSSFRQPKPKTEAST